MYWRFFYTQPWSQTSVSLSSRQGMIWECWSKTASSSTNSIAVSGNSGRMTLLTKKCFLLWLGFTAVHLLSSNFLGLRRFFSLELIASKFIFVADEFAWTRSKDIAGVLNLSRALQVKITQWAKASTVVILTILKLHLRFFENQRRFGSSAICTRPGSVSFSPTSWES